MTVPTPEDLARQAGTRLTAVVPCPKQGVGLRKRQSDEPGFALAFSGGGFRASLAALGVLRFFASADLLSRVRVVSSVSGGSVTNGLFAVKYREIALGGFSLEAFDKAVTTPLLSYITLKSMTRKLLANSWKAAGPATRTTLLASALDQWLYGGFKMHKLSTECDFVINATNLNTGVRFGFQQYRIGDYVLGFVKPQLPLRVSEAVAASAAVPGVFAPLVLSNNKYPCDRGFLPELVDGGVYDNLGLEPVKNLRRDCLVVLNAGGVFRVGRFGGVPILRALVRSNSVMYRQTSALRMQELVERFKMWERATERGQNPPTLGRRGVVFGIGTTMKDIPSYWLSGRPDEGNPEELANLPTSFARFKLDEAQRLVYRGWWLTGASLAKRHPDLVATWPPVVAMPLRLRRRWIRLPGKPPLKVRR